MYRGAKGQAFGLLFVTFFIWGSVYVGGKMIADQIPAALLACLRCCTAMAPLLWMSRRFRGIKIAREDWKYFFIVGLLGYFLTIFFIQLINALTPVSVTILAALVLKEKITPIKVLCLVLALAGAIVITQGAGTQSETMGIVVVLSSVIFWGFASVHMRRLTSKYPAVLVTTYSMAISLLCHVPAGLISLATQPVEF